MIKLNNGQQKIVNSAINWFYNSSEQVFQIDGEAGTGKSVTMNSIVQLLKLKMDEILPMAFTGQAAIVMRTKGLRNATTLHSGLFDPVEVVMKDERGNPIIDKQFNTPVTKWEFIPKNFTNSKIKLMIVDEAWTAPLRFKKIIERHGIKVLVAGDSGQLPPVNDYPAYLTGGKIHHLTEFTRQAESSPLLYLAHRARMGKEIEYGLYGDKVLVISEDELNLDILSRGNIILTAKNATRDRLNKLVREDILHINSKFPVYGESVICKKNNWNKSIDNISLANGLRGIVANMPNPLTYDKRDKTFEMEFIPDLLNNSFVGLKVNYPYYIGEKGIRDSLRNSPFTKGELFEPAYASTVYSAQGSEYDSGIYIEEYMNPRTYFCQNYTAITRFRDKLIYVKHTPKYW